MNGGRSWFRVLALVLGFAFLYIPIVSLVVYSFNESRLVTVWGGFSTKWYGELLDNQQIIDAALLSLKIAAIAASIAVVLGTLAGMALARFGPFRGRTLLSGHGDGAARHARGDHRPVAAAAVRHLEQLIGWPDGRGMTTIIIAHVTFAMAFVTVVVQSRLAQFDESLEEAAQDLGARPAKVFFLITLPIIFPALLSGWLLAFTLSLDDLVIASFVAGPGSTTLPMVVFSKVRLGVSPEINALATILIAIVSVGVAIAGVVMSRQQKMRDRDAQMALAANQQMIESLKKG